MSTGSWAAFSGWCVAVSWRPPPLSCTQLVLGALVVVLVALPRTSGGAVLCMCSGGCGVGIELNFVLAQAVTKALPVWTPNRPGPSPNCSVTMDAALVAVASMGLLLSVWPVGTLKAVLWIPVLPRAIRVGVVGYLDTHAALIAAADAALTPASGKPCAPRPTHVDTSVPMKRVLKEVAHRVQLRFVVTAVVANLLLQTVGLVRPRFLGSVFDHVVQGAVEDSIAVYWSYARTFIAFLLLDFVFITVRDTCTYGASHRFRRDTRSAMLGMCCTVHYCSCSTCGGRVDIQPTTVRVHCCAQQTCCDKT